MTLRRLVAGATGTTLVVAALALGPVPSAVADETVPSVAAAPGPPPVVAALPLAPAPSAVADETVPSVAAAAVATLSVPDVVLGLGGQPVPLGITVGGTAEGDRVTVGLVLADAPAEIVS